MPGADVPLKLPLRDRIVLCGCSSAEEACARHGGVSLLLHEMWFRTATRENSMMALREDFSVAQRCFDAGTLTWSQSECQQGTPVVAVLDPSTLSLEESVPVFGPLADSDLPAHLLRQMICAADDPTKPEYIWYNVFMAAKQREETWLVLLVCIIDRFKVDGLGLTRAPNTLMRCKGCAVCGEDACVPCPVCGAHFWCSRAHCRSEDESRHRAGPGCDPDLMLVRDFRLTKMDVLGTVPN